VAVALTQIAVIATSIYLHRALAHRSLRLHPVTDVVFRVILWLTTGQRRQQWVAVHRKHRTFTDREGDPHSPRLVGVWRVQLFNVCYYVRECRNAHTIATFAPDLPEDRLDRAVFSHGLVGVSVGLVLLGVVIGPWPGLIAGLTHAVLYVFVLAPLINALGHWHGRQKFANTAYNLRLFAWVSAGESLHNNHHAHPRSAKFSVRRGESRSVVAGDPRARRGAPARHRRATGGVGVGGRGHAPRDADGDHQLIGGPLRNPRASRRLWPFHGGGVGPDSVEDPPASVLASGSVGPLEQARPPAPGLQGMLGPQGSPA
jgi:stearoyl-CoA desaturase (delta-9 desaturase)